MPETGRPDKLSLIVFSPDFDKVHYALVLASAAAAIGTPVTLFFTMHAARALAPGWRDMRCADGRTAGAMDDDFAARKVATFGELLEACVSLGVRLMVCEMGLRALGMSRADLRQDLEIGLGGVVTFLNDASRDGAMLFL